MCQISNKLKNQSYVKNATCQFYIIKTRRYFDQYFAFPEH